ncbi:NUDIX domain-containing protein [Gracilibacillus salitolerans]|uniref:NUDIX domain-containing protein n=1 Tax=Gracilibacillus salitolerans TaxID=2663022 RepID=A0A5Q2TJ42_9BACI|nr:NUDIX domain-containing protein [Gracilibacillus salitolerans]
MCLDDGKLLVINKSGGPYINRYDLPGGSLEDGEALSEAMKREFLEETGLKIKIEENIGVIDFKLPWLWRDFTDVHHIAVYYFVKKIGGELSAPEQFDGQDSLEAIRVSEKDISLDNASPLVIKAFEWLRTGNLGIEAKTYEEWKVL